MTSHSTSCPDSNSAATCSTQFHAEEEELADDERGFGRRLAAGESVARRRANSPTSSSLRRRGSSKQGGKVVIDDEAAPAAAAVTGSSADDKCFDDCVYNDDDESVSGASCPAATCLGATAVVKGVMTTPERKRKSGLATVSPPKVSYFTIHTRMSTRASQTLK